MSLILIAPELTKLPTYPVMTRRFSVSHEQRSYSLTHLHTWTFNFVRLKLIGLNLIYYYIYYNIYNNILNYKLERC